MRVKAEPEVTSVVKTEPEPEAPSVKYEPASTFTFGMIGTEPLYVDYNSPLYAPFSPPASPPSSPEQTFQFTQTEAVSEPSLAPRPRLETPRPAEPVVHVSARYDDSVYNIPYGHAIVVLGAVDLLVNQLEGLLVYQKGLPARHDAYDVIVVVQYKPLIKVMDVALEFAWLPARLKRKANRLANITKRRLTDWIKMITI